MLIVNFALFIGIFVGMTYLLELLFPPFGMLYNTDMVIILNSIAQEIGYRLNINPNYYFIVTVVIVSIIPFTLVVSLNIYLRKRRNEIKKTI